MAIDIWWYESRGSWCADVPAEKGRKRLYLGPEERKAQAKLHRYMAQYYDSLDPDAVDSRPALRQPTDCISLLELAVMFLHWNKTNRADGTWRTYRDGLKHVTRRHKAKLATELTLRDIERIKTEMISNGYAARTINIMASAVKRLYRWGVKQELVDENPVSNLEFVSRHVNAPEHPKEKYLPLNRALECIEALRSSPPLGDMSEMLLLTGMRIEELTRVTWQDVDFNQRMLRLAMHKTVGATGRPRQIPLCERALEILRSHGSEGVEPDKVIFRGCRGQALIVPALQCRLRRLRKKHPVLEDFSFHKMRHTAATYLARLNVPERTAQAILGHSSTLMTRYYTATDPREMLEAVERLSRAAGGEN